MAKVRYKELPKSFQEMVQPLPAPKIRASVGMEQSIGEFYYIPIEKLKPYHKQARKVFDEAELEGLALTIKKHGISQPLSIIRSESDTFEIISGERRYRAALMAGLQKVPCIILDPQKSAEEIALIENIQRSDLHPLEISNCIAELLNGSARGDQQELANRLGLSKSKMSEYISYQNIPENVRNLIISKKVRGRELLRKFSSADQQEMKSLMQNELSENGKLVDPGHEARTKTVLRINFENDQLRIQKRGLRRLTQIERQLVRTKLEELIKDLS